MGGLSDVKDFWGKTWLEEIERRGYIYTWLDYKLTKKYVKDSLKYSLVKNYRRIRAPTLFVYGELDDSVPPSEGLKFYKKIKVPKKLVILKELDHVFSGEKVKKHVIRITLQWLNKWIKKN
jgi:dipeptidyl aminopeptidase/acylaminoacyl peptidase